MHSITYGARTFKVGDQVRDLSDDDLGIGKVLNIRSTGQPRQYLVDVSFGQGIYARWPENVLPITNRK